MDFKKSMGTFVSSFSFRYMNIRSILQLENYSIFRQIKKRPTQLREGRFTHCYFFDALY